MRLRVSRIDPTLPMPTYQTPGSVAFDLHVRTETVVAPHAVGLVPVNIVVCVPDGYALILASRSSTPMKKGLSTPHGIGVIDCDYCGPTDELKVQVFNFTDQPVTVARCERIAQAMLVPVVKCELEEVRAGEIKNRGGFGSTG